MGHTQEEGERCVAALSETFGRTRERGGGERGELKGGRTMRVFFFLKKKR